MLAPMIMMGYALSIGPVEWLYVRYFPNWNGTEAYVVYRPLYLTIGKIEPASKWLDRYVVWWIELGHRQNELEIQRKIDAADFPPE